MTAGRPVSEFSWRQIGRTMMRSSQAILRAGLEFTLPSSCIFCGQEPDGEPLRFSLCAECRDQLKPKPGPQCERCAAPVGPHLETADGCFHCRDDKFHFRGVIRLGVYQDQLRLAVLRAKAVGGEALARSLADLLFAEAADGWQNLPCDAVVAVPHFWTRRFHPGHAASETLAERLAWHLKLPLARGVLRKTRWTPAQASSPPSVRKQQQRRAFAATKAAKGRRFLLIDDVLTTGATANECSQALLQAGAASVAIAVLARGIGEGK